MSKFTNSLNLRAVGFCGIDDTVEPELLQLLSFHYPWIEWGVLLRPDMEGQPRYASSAYLERLYKVNKETGCMMRLAGHLCKQRCQEILDGDYSYAKQLVSHGFGRFQVNATALNGVVVDPNKIDEYVENIKKCINAVPEVEWIIQANTETKPIWERLVIPTSKSSNSKNSIEVSLPPNMSILFDASCGMGTLASTYPQPLVISTNSCNNIDVGTKNDAKDIDVLCGYAGGIGPNTIEGVCESLSKVTNGKRIWIDMESSLRTFQSNKLNDTPVDVFDIHKCFKCIQIVKKYGLPVSKISLMSV